MPQRGPSPLSGTLHRAQVSGGRSTYHGVHMLSRGLGARDDSRQRVGDICALLGAHIFSAPLPPSPRTPARQRWAGCREEDRTLVDRRRRARARRRAASRRAPHRVVRVGFGGRLQAWRLALCSPSAKGALRRGICARVGGGRLPMPPVRRPPPSIRARGSTPPPTPRETTPKKASCKKSVEPLRGVRLRPPLRPSLHHTCPPTPTPPTHAAVHVRSPFVRHRCEQEEPALRGQSSEPGRLVRLRKVANQTRRRYCRAEGPRPAPRTHDPPPPREARAWRS